MNFLMLCRAPWLYSCERLMTAAQQRGHQMRIVDPNRCVLKLVEKTPRFEIFYQQDEHSELELLSDYDGVLPRFGANSTQMGCFVLQHFQGLGVSCLNDERAFQLARDKWQSLQCLTQAHIPVPTSMFAGCETHLSSVLNSSPMPMVLKTLQGMQGEGVMLAHSAEQIKALQAKHSPMLMQQFIREASATDIRCFVIGDEVVATMQRQGQGDEFRANCHLGGEAQKMDLPEEAKRLAVHAAQAIGLDVAGVDLIPSEKGYLVLEVNASPGLEMIEKTSGVDIASKMITYFETKITKSKNSSEFHRALA